MSQVKEPSSAPSRGFREALERLRKAPRSRDRVTLSVELSPEMDELIRSVAAEAGTDEGDIFRRALALYLIALEARGEGKRLGVVAPEQEVLTEFEL